MRVLLTGSAGYIGSILGPLLQQSGHEVVGVDSGLYCSGNLGSVTASIPCWWKDVRDLKPAELSGFDAVLHLAGISNDPVGDMDADVTMEVNYRASVRLARFAKQAGVSRFLFASSCSLYGASSSHDILNEQAAFHPVTPYGESKILVEQDLQSLADDSFSPTYLRCATAYGYSPRLRADLVVNNLVGHAFLDGLVLLKSDGTSWRPLVHIEDISRAYLAILEAPQELVHNQAFNVGRTAENYRIRDVAELVHQIVPDCELRFADGASADKRCYRIDCQKLEKTLPTYQPRWTVRDGIEQLYQAYREHELNRANFCGPRFMRIQRVQSLQRQNRLDHRLHWMPGPTDPAPEFDNYESRTRCRSCDSTSLVEVLSLGDVPLADRLVSDEQLTSPEPHFPLTVCFCRDCALTQIRETVPPELLYCQNYPYFSSFSESWLEHCRENALELIHQRGLDASSLVLEIASNDGYLLKNFVAHDIPVLGIDPAEGPNQVAREAGITILPEFFTLELAKQLAHQGQTADVILANNVLAHVPDLPGFVEGIRWVLKETGVAVIEVPYVADLVDHNEFDTIYHEHLCYFSLTSLSRLFARHNLHLNDVRRLPTHGGSLRLYVEKHRHPSPAVIAMLRQEQERKIDRIEYFRDFADRVRHVQSQLTTLLTDLKQRGKRVAAYGAAAKGASLLTASRIPADLIEFVVDRNIHKHGKHIPGSHQPIYEPTELLKRQPDYVLLLAWNYREEILRQQAEFHSRGGRFVVPIPECEIINSSVTRVSSTRIRRVSKASESPTPNYKPERPCPSCSGDQWTDFFRVDDVPAHSVLLMNSREQATSFPCGTVQLACCQQCGFIFNSRFDPRLNDYGASYEETQHFSPRFNEFAEQLVHRLVADYGIRNKRVLEIGCGKGEFLALLCQRGDNWGIGVDPACDPDRLPTDVSAQMHFVPELFGPQHAKLPADVICCRHTLEHIGPTENFLRTVRQTMSRSRAKLAFFEVPDVTPILRHLRFWDVYYEHCSYFDTQSLSALFQRCGFEVLETQREYDDQYLWLVARPVGANHRRPEAATASERASLTQDVEHFRNNCPQAIRAWRRQIQEYANRGQRPVLWGAGSKCVAFLTTTGIQDEIEYVVDINPHKQGRFLPGSGHEVIAPDSLRAYQPQVVLAMNAIYRDEIARSLAQMNVACEVVPLSDGLVTGPQPGLCEGQPAQT